MRTLTQACGGVTELDGDGSAVVLVPAWFTPDAAEVCYQLTCMGDFAPVYIDVPLQRGCFRVAGGRPGVRVSWQLTVASQATSEDVPRTALTPRMQATLDVLMTGASNKEIASRLGISQNTVHQYVKSLLRTYDVSSRAELVARLLSSCSCQRPSTST